jgi:hypothetical protein
VVALNDPMNGNLYAYVKDNPVNNVDRAGNQSRPGGYEVHATRPPVIPIAAISRPCQLRPSLQFQTVVPSELASTPFFLD